jgi:hypothetical protein
MSARLLRRAFQAHHVGRPTEARPAERMKPPKGEREAQTNQATATSAYVRFAQAVLGDLGLRERCQVRDVSGGQDAYRWSLLFTLSTGQVSVWGDESLTDPTDREVITLKLRTELLDHINQYGI